MMKSLLRIVVHLALTAITVYITACSASVALSYFERRSYLGWDQASGKVFSATNHPLYSKVIWTAGAYGSDTGYPHQTTAEEQRLLSLSDPETGYFFAYSVGRPLSLVYGTMDVVQNRGSPYHGMIMFDELEIPGLKVPQMVFYPRYLNIAIVAGLLYAALVGLWHGALHVRGVVRRRNGLCSTCGYANNGGRCPECGHVDPARPAEPAAVVA